MLDAQIFFEYLKKELGITRWVSEIYLFWKSLPAVRKILGGDFFHKFEFNEFFFPASNFLTQKYINMDFKKDKRLLPCGAFSFFRRFPAIPRFSAEIAPADRPRKAVSAKKKAVNIGEL